MARNLASDEARLLGRIGGLRLAGLRDPKQYTAEARRRFLAGDHSRCHVCGCPPPIPDDLPEPERQRRLEARLGAHMALLAYRSAQRRKAA